MCTAGRDSAKPDKTDASVPATLQTIYDYERRTLALLCVASHGRDHHHATTTSHYIL